MAWNEPGKGQDPWGGGNRGGGPPDLDEVWRRLRKRFGGRGGGSGGDSGGPPARLLFALIPVVAVIWLLTGFYIVQPGERGVILQFGAHQATVGPGLHWHVPYPVAWVLTVDVEKVRSAQAGGIMLTKDENLVDIRVTAQYSVADPEAYLFNVRHPDRTVERALRSAIREIVSTSRMNQVIQEGVDASELKQDVLERIDLQDTQQQAPEEDVLGHLPPELRKKIKAQKQAYPEIEKRSRAMLPENISKILRSMLSEYGLGANVTAINVHYAQPPEPVQPAFEAAIMAREEQERKKNLARAYARKIVTRARGKAAQILLEAKAYRAATIAQARGRAARFSAILQEYLQAPKVVRERLYLDTMDEVLDQSHLLLMGQEDGAPLLYVPLQEMFHSGANNKSEQTGKQNGDSANTGGYSGTEQSNSGNSEFRSRERRR